MDEGEHSNTMVEEVAETSFKKRPRKKHLFSQILHQMEFYFSDANLARDRYLSQLIGENKNVPLEVFLRFNKIRALTGNTEEIAKALGTSEFLKITEDGKCVYRTTAVQKKENQDDCVIYVEQLPPDANHDWVSGIFSAYGKVEYVSIPKYKNRATIKGFAFVEFDTPEAAKKALEAFGSAGCCLPPQMPPEELCSIATFEDSEETHVKGKEGDSETQAPEKQTKKHKKIKNFGDDTEETKDFEIIHETNHAETGEEPKLKKLKFEIDEHYMGEKPKKKKRKEMVDNNDIQQETVKDNDIESESAELIKTKKNKKRKLENENTGDLIETKSSNMEEGTDDAPTKKKKKKYLEQEETTNDEREVPQGEGMVEREAQAAVKSKKKKKHHQVEDSAEVKIDTEEMEEADVSHHLQGTKKKSKKKRYEEVENEGDADREEDAEDEGISKRPKKQTNEKDKDEEDSVDEAGGDSEKSDKKKRSRKRNKKKSGDKKDELASLGLRIIAIIEWRRLRNKYLNLQREKMQALKKNLARAKFGSNYQSPFPAKENGRKEVKQELKPQAKKTEYLSGVIIHIDLAEPLGDVLSFKNDAKSHLGVTYVDANEGDSEVHIRCTSTEVAQKLVGDKLWNNMKILEGNAENIYWEKIWEDRKNKMKNKVRVTTRGRDKLLKRAERELGKHIKFDD